MNYNDVSTQNDGNEYHRASSNLNTAIENANDNISNVMSINMQNSTNFDMNVNPQTDVLNSSDVSVSSNFGVSNNDTMQGENNRVDQSVNNLNNNFNQQVGSTQSTFVQGSNLSDSNNYFPVMENHHQDKKNKVVLSKELLLIFVLSVILVVFVMSLPFLYNFFKGLKDAAGR